MKGKITITKNSMENEFITRGKLVPIIQDLKEFISTTVKGSEHVLRTDLGGKIDKLDDRMTIVEAKLDATQHYMIKMEKRLDEKIDITRAELKETEKRLDDKIDITRNELSNKIETLSKKVDKAVDHLDDHEHRIVLLETA